MNEKTVFAMRLNRELKLKGLTSEKIIEAARAVDLTINDFLGACVIEHIGKPDDYEYLATRLMRIRNPKVNRETHKKLIEHLRNMDSDLLRAWGEQ